MTAREVVKPIEDFAPLSMQESWDNSGFSVGNPDKEVGKALIALDCTENVMREAVREGCDLVIAHHPLIFGKLKSVTPEHITGRIIETAIRHGIVVYSAHTNMDKAAGGVSGLMAHKLELTGVRPLQADGFGAVGDMKTPLTAGAFVKFVREKMGIPRLRTSRPLKSLVRRVAVCGGSGRSFISDARSEGAQVYITGDLTYHDFFCENDFMVMDIGHYNSEYDVVRLFSEILCKNFPNFTVSITKENNNPIYYY